MHWLIKSYVFVDCEAKTLKKLDDSVIPNHICTIYVYGYIFASFFSRVLELKNANIYHIINIKPHFFDYFN